MSVTQIPPRDPLAPPRESHDLSEAQHWETAYRGFRPDAVPHLLIQLQDDLSRSRKREAVWLSVVLHLLIVILLIKTDKLLSLCRTGPWLPATIDLDKQKDATYLSCRRTNEADSPPGFQIISDKDLSATSKAPQINRQELKPWRVRVRGRPTQGPSNRRLPPRRATAATADQEPPPNPNPGLSRPLRTPTAQLQAPPRQAACHSHNRRFRD
jgi:hypothetical protein